MLTIPAPPYDSSLRYAVWRAIALAKGRDALSAQVKRIDLADNGSEAPAVMLWGMSDECLEAITYQEHDGVLQFDRIREFLANRHVEPIGTSPRTRRFVSNSRLAHVAPGESLWDFGNAADRRRALASHNLSPADQEVVWDVGPHRGKLALTAESLVSLAHTESGDDRALYLLLYGRLAAAWLSRHAPLEARQEVFPVALLCDLYGSTLMRPEPTLSAPAEEGLDIAWLRQELFSSVSAAPVSTVTQEEVAKVLRRGLFGETKVTLEEIYVSHKAMLAIPDEERKMSQLWSGRVIELMFRWLAEARSGRRTKYPLLVLGSFGSGKSSLLTEFAHELLLKEKSIVPLLVPLRDLRGASAARPLADELAEHLLRKWQVDIKSPPPRGACYCLLCDGFDELELYYRAIEAERWVSECFRSLSLLAERERLYVVIASRPILLMDIRRRRFEGELCPNLSLDPFGRLDIDQWCLNYQRATGLSEFLNSEFLEERNLLEVARTPLVLYMLARLFEIEGASLQARRRFSRAEIYRSFLDWTCRGGYIGDDAKHDVPVNYREVLREIGWIFYRSGDGVLSEDRLLAELRKAFGERAPDHVPIDRNVLVAHMLQPAELGAREISHPIEFTHQSFREYLVAERIWECLAGARRGESLSPSVWLGLHQGKAFSSSEIQFLSDLVGELSWSDAGRLYAALKDTDNIHQYWIRWLSPVWDRLRLKLEVESVEAASSAVGTAASRACNLATLGFLLRVKCFHRLRTLAKEGHDLPEPPSAELLGRLLHLLAAFPETGGIGSDNRDLLLQNLQGLVLASGAALANQELETPCLRDAVMPGVSFIGSQWTDAAIDGADLTGARFDNCFLHFNGTRGASLRQASFIDASLTHAESTPIREADFSGACFQRARLLDVSLIDCRFVDNEWSGAAHFRTSRREAGSLIRCELDDKAERFFTGQGLVLERCNRV